MATLTGSSIATTYTQLLKLTSASLGADDSAKFIEDGAGTDSALSISTTRVGIGTSSPAKELQITTASGESTLRLQSATFYSDILQSGRNLFIQNAAGAGNIIFYDDAAERMRIDTDGNVGIGDSAPLSVLHVQGSSSGVVQLFINNINGGTNSSSDLVFGTWSGTIPTGTGNPGPQAKISAINTDSGTAATDLAFSTYGSATSAERMRITSAGNVGIGDTDPSEAKLSITGVASGDYALKIDDDVAGTTCVYIDSEATGHCVNIDAPATTTGRVLLINDANALTSGGIIYCSSDSDSTTARDLVTIINDDAASVATVPLRIQQDSTEPVTIDHNLTATTTDIATSLYIDFDATGITASGQTATNIGFDLDMNSEVPTMVGTVNNIGLDLDVVGGTTGTTKNIGIDVAVSGADTNYAALFNGGNVGIGIAAPAKTLHIGSDSVTGEFIRMGNTTNGENVGIGKLATDAADLVFYTAAVAKMTILEAGNVGIGTTSPSSSLEVAKGSASAELTITSYSVTTTHGGILNLQHSKNNTVGTNTYIADDTLLGGIIFRGADGSDFEEGASIKAFVDGDPLSGGDASDIPTRLVFATTPNGTNAAVDRITVLESGNVGIGNTAPGSLLEVTALASASESARPSIEISSFSDANDTSTAAGVLKFHKSADDDLNSYGTDSHTATGEIIGRVEAWGVTNKDDDSDAPFLSAYIEFAGDAVANDDSAAGKMIFATASDAGAATSRLTIDDGGNVNVVGGNFTVSSGNITVGTAGKGIDFSNQASPSAGMTAELLDRYETGTWTPVLSDGTNNATMHADAAGQYTRIGNVVRVSALLQTTGLGSVSGTVRMTGLPFTTRNDNDSYGGLFFSGAGGLDITATESLTLMLAVNTTYATLRIWNAATGTALLNGTEWSANGEAYVAGTYIV